MNNSISRSIIAFGPDRDATEFMNDVIRLAKSGTSIKNDRYSFYVCDSAYAHVTVHYQEDEGKIPNELLDLASRFRRLRFAFVSRPNNDPLEMDFKVEKLDGNMSEFNIRSMDYDDYRAGVRPKRNEKWKELNDLVFFDKGIASALYTLGHFPDRLKGQVYIN